MIRFMMIILIVSISFSAIQAQNEVPERNQLERIQFEGNELQAQERKAQERIFEKEIFEKRVFPPSRDVFDDFSPPENQVIKNPGVDGNSFFGGATKQNEQEFRDARLKKLSKLDFIERRVIERSFNSFLRRNLENKMTASRKSMFKRLTAEVKNLRKVRNTRLAKKNAKNKVAEVQPQKPQQQK